MDSVSHPTPGFWAAVGLFDDVVGCSKHLRSGWLPAARSACGQMRTSTRRH